MKKKLIIITNTENLDETDYGIDKEKFNDDIDQKKEKFVCIFKNRKKCK